MDITLPPVELALNSYPGTATQATVSTPAPAPNERMIVRSIALSLAANAAPQTPIQWVVRDGATAVGTVLLTGVMGAPVNGFCEVNIQGLNLPLPTAGNVATVEFTGAGVAGSQEAVSFTYSREFANG